MRLLEVYESQNTIYMIMDLLQGGSLYEYLGKNWCPDAGKVKAIISQILRGRTEY
jgi:serine/threonine protein kinase